jgi:serine/threonine protein kinase
MFHYDEKKFKKLKVLGEGSFGKVYKIKLEDEIGDKKEDEKYYALKVVSNKNYDNDDNEGIQVEFLREANVLNKIPQHENIIKLLQPGFLPLNDRPYLLLEYLNGGNLLEYLESYVMRTYNNNKQKPKQMSTSLIQPPPLIRILNLVKKIMSQLLKGLNHLHQHRFIHRDLKPQNLLISTNNNNNDDSDNFNKIVIADFGLARELHFSSSSSSHTHTNNNDTITMETCKFTEYVVTLPYRAPELILHEKKYFSDNNDTNSFIYSSEIDIWSLGCIFAELIALAFRLKLHATNDDSHHSRLFPTEYGNDSNDHLGFIFSLLGLPSEKIMPEMKFCAPKSINFIISSASSQNQQIVFVNDNDECKHRLGEFLKLQPLSSTPLLSSGKKKGITGIKKRKTKYNRDQIKNIIKIEKESMLDLLSKMLLYDRKKRITAKIALDHPYFNV